MNTNYFLIALALTNFISHLSACPSPCEFGIKKTRSKSGFVDCSCEMNNPCQTKACPPSRICRLVFVNLNDKVFKSAVAVCILGINLVNILNFQGKFSFENELNFQESKIVEMPTRLFNATSKILMPNSTTSTKLSSELKKTRSKTTKFPKVNYFVYVDQMFVDNVEVNLGTNLDIVCYNSHGNVNGTIFWSRDELDSQEKLTQNRTSFNSHMLRIRYFRKEDSGYYICTVVEENGEHKKVTIKLTENANKKRPEASSTRTNSILNDGSSADHQEVSHTNSSILTKVTSPRLPIKVNVQPKRQWVDFHDFVEFKCIVEFPYLFENLKLKWNHNYVDLKIKKSINESNLRLAFVTENDGGDYTCTVTDENGNKYEDTGTLIVMGLAENTEKSITQVNFMTTPARFSYSIWKKSTLARVNPGDKHSAKDFSFNARVKEGDSFTFSCEKYLTSDTLKFEKFDNKLLTWLQIDQVEKNGNVEKIVLTNLKQRDISYVKCSSRGKTLKAVFVQIIP